MPLSLLYFFLLFIAMSVSFSQTSWLPAMTAISDYLYVSPHEFQWFSSVFSLSLVASILFYSVISALYGRKPAFFIGSAFFLTGCSVILFADKLYLWLLGGGLIGFGMGAMSVTTRMVVSDVYSGKERNERISILNVCFQIALPVSPLLGALVLHNFGWYAIFVLLFVYALVVTFFIVLLPETKTVKNEETQSESASEYLFDFFYVLKFRPVLGFACVSMFIGIPISAWLNMGPVVMVHHYHVAPIDYSYILLFTNLLPAVFALSNGFLSDRFGYDFIMKTGWIVGLISACALALFNLVYFNLQLQVISVFFIILSAILVSTNALIGMITLQSQFPKKYLVFSVGVYVLFWIASVAIGSTVASILIETDLLPLAIVSFISVIVSFMFYLYANHSAVKK